MTDLSGRLWLAAAAHGRCRRVQPRRGLQKTAWAAAGAPSARGSARCGLLRLVGAGGEESCAGSDYFSCGRVRGRTLWASQRRRLPLPVQSNSGQAARARGKASHRLMHLALLAAAAQRRRPFAPGAHPPAPPAPHSNIQPPDRPWQLGVGRLACTPLPALHQAPSSPSQPPQRPSSSTGTRLQGARMSVLGALAAALGRGRRVPRLGFTRLTTKQGPRTYYKGKGAAPTGEHTSKGAQQAGRARSTAGGGAGACISPAGSSGGTPALRLHRRIQQLTACPGCWHSPALLDLTSRCRRRRLRGAGAPPAHLHCARPQRLQGAPAGPPLVLSVLAPSAKRVLGGGGSSCCWQRGVQGQQCGARRRRQLLCAACMFGWAEPRWPAN